MDELHLAYLSKEQYEASYGNLCTNEKGEIDKYELTFLIMEMSGLALPANHENIQDKIGFIQMYDRLESDYDSDY